MSVQPFQVHVPDAVLEDLRGRLNTARLPPGEADDWSAGMNPAYLRRLVDHWRSAYDWRAREGQMNRLAHFRAEIGGTSIHFIHASVPCFRCSGVEFFIISAIPEALAMYKARNFFMGVLRPGTVGP